MRHVAKVFVTPEVITDMLTVGNKARAHECIQGLPEGAVLVNAFINRRDELELHFSHSTFPLVDEGAEPTMTIIPCMECK
jgi:hypothetical protein